MALPLDAETSIPSVSASRDQKRVISLDDTGSNSPHRDFFVEWQIGPASEEASALELTLRESR